MRYRHDDHRTRRSPRGGAAKIGSHAVTGADSRPVLRPSQPGARVSRPPAGPAGGRGGGGGGALQRSSPVRSRRPRRHGVVDHRGRRTHDRLLAGRGRRSRLRALRAPLRRPADRGRCCSNAGLHRGRATRARSARPRRHWPRACPRRTCSATSTRWPPGWRRSSSRPRAPRRRRRPGARSSGRSRRPARRRWPPRRSSWPPRRRSGRPPATACGRSSTSGRPSAESTARPTTRCGSATRRRARRSTGAAARISPNWTGSGPALGRPRRRCACAPRN